MALAAATLSTALAGAGFTSSDAATAQAWSAAFATYAAGAQAATPILAAGVTLGRTAMESALAGMSAPNQAAPRLAAGVAAFWAAVAGGLAASFAGATAITPPTYPGLEGALVACFDANRDSAATLAQAMDAITGVMHSIRAGGSVTTPGPTVTIIT